MSWCLVLKAVRRGAGLNQSQLASRVGTSRSRLSAYESGAVVPSVELFERLVAAAGAQFRVCAAPALSGAEEKSLRLHRAIAERLVSDPETVLAKARTNLATMRSADTAGHATSYLDEWEWLVSGPLIQLVDQMLSRSQHAADLRQSTPFAGVLAPQDRLAAMRGDACAS